MTARWTSSEVDVLCLEIWIALAIGVLQAAHLILEGEQYFDVFEHFCTHEGGITSPSRFRQAFHGHFEQLLDAGGQLCEGVGTRCSKHCRGSQRMAKWLALIAHRLLDELSFATHPNDLAVLSAGFRRRRGDLRERRPSSFALRSQQRQQDLLQQGDLDAEPKSGPVVS